MPKSRGRRPRKARTYTSRRRAGGPGASGADTARMFSILQAADDAESRGDAVRALDLMAQHAWDRDGKLFWRPERLFRLGQIVMLGPVLPGWARSRWILGQAVAVLDEASRGRCRQAIGVVMGLRVDAPWPADPSYDEQRVKVMDHDWVYRQLVLFELGGLDHFITDVASPDLLAGADHVREWMSTPMGGFRYVGSSHRHLIWEHLATGEQLETINLGAAALLEPGDCVIGRPVPIEEGTMWESAPLFVPGDVAVRVAEDPANWVATLEEAGHWTDELTTHRGEFALLTDVPDFVRLELARGVADRGARHPRRSVGDVVRDEARLLVLAAIKADLDDRDEDDTRGSMWPTVAASLLEPGVCSMVLDRLSTADAVSVAALADRLAGPAADLCLGIAMDLRESA